MGDSDGAPQAFDSIDEDIDAAVHVIHKRFPGCQIVLMGLCDAASAILMRAAGAELPAAGAVLLNPWVRTQQTAARARAQHYYQGRLVSRAFWRRLLRLEVNPLRAFGGLLRDLAAARRSEGTESQDFLSRMAKGLASTQQPVLLALSSEDLTAKEFQSLVDGSVQWQESLGRRNVVRMDIDGADHTFSDPEALDQVNTTILSWIRQSFAK
jgi:exosortase A-associated hydrolase 1